LDFVWANEDFVEKKIRSGGRSLMETRVDNEWRGKRHREAPDKK
jgi:hypothetical protein